MPPVSSQPRIIVVTPFWPHRTSIGSEVRLRLTLEALRSVGSVDVLVLADPGAMPKGDSPPVPTGVGSVRSVSVRPQPRQGWGGKATWLFNPRSSYPHGCGVDVEEAAQFQARINNYDLVWFFKLRSPNLFAEAHWPRSLVDIDDVPSTYDQEVMKHATGLRERLLARIRYHSWRARERRLGERFNVLAVCSAPDREYLQRLGVTVPIHVIPNGFARPARLPSPQPVRPPRIGFIGLFDYPPNHEGIHWFVRECWPRIKARVPDARLRLAGRGTDGPLKPPGPDIDGLGFVAAADEEIATWAGSVVPIRLGAGTRVKIAQGFAQKCPLISTTLGALGYDAVNGRELFLADDPAGFAEACLRVIEHPDEARQMAGRAWQVFLAKWTWEAIAPRIHAAAEECLRLNARR